MSVNLLPGTSQAAVQNAVAAAGAELGLPANAVEDSVVSRAS